ncbi:AI-2E family transporter [Acinetobacter larvae]|uniref:AI-2E family transporter n=1 Tax=Acinetobacter larvae TaxID=1789224 RepID=A0A1B2LVF8_9GAMM|nr:AI-2E family transporter [Acinetobacter larvae]AOA56922.1 AI-2E family transporter [Acinetobacter larvae]
MRQQQRSWHDSLQTMVYVLLFIILLGWLIKVGQNFLLPILMAVISMYIIVTLTDFLGRFIFLKHSSEAIRRLLVFVAFMATVFGLSQIIYITGQQIVASLPIYQNNLEKIVIDMSVQLGLSQDPDWQLLRAMTIDKIDIHPFISASISALSTLTGMVVLVVVYALFLISERGRFATRFAMAFSGQGADQTRTLLLNINRKIGDYLAIKSLINVILAVICWLILWLCGVEHALFWALIIGLLNYIPYIGSLLGVIFPVILTLAQFGSMQMTLLVAVLLTVAQMYVGNVLEPKMIGKQINLSPFVVLVSLSLWASLWGVAGAILAVPLTSIFVIILGAFPSTRAFALLMVDDPVAYQLEMKNMAAQTEAKQIAE